MSIKEVTCMREIDWLVARVWIAYDKLEEHGKKKPTYNRDPIELKQMVHAL